MRFFFFRKLVDGLKSIRKRGRVVWLNINNRFKTFVFFFKTKPITFLFQCRYRIRLYHSCAVQTHILNEKLYLT